MTSESVEARALRVVREYMEISYAPGRSSARAVAHLCAKDSVFISPTTFPGVSDVPGYAEEHAVVMRSIPDLRIVKFDQLFCSNMEPQFQGGQSQQGYQQQVQQGMTRGGSAGPGQGGIIRVACRYVAEGSHCGEPFKGVQPNKANPRKARWSATCLFEANNEGLIVRMTKDWDIHAMFDPLGWPLPPVKGQVPTEAYLGPGKATLGQGKGQGQGQANMTGKDVASATARETVVGKPAVRT